LKYVILIGDGMSDEPIESLGGKTPLEASKTPNMDMLAQSGYFGVFNTVPEGLPPGSDVANLSILGYDPKKYYSGRAPLEAASLGVKLAADDVAYRCNLVSLSNGYNDKSLMNDYSAGHISTEEAALIIESLDKELSGEGIKFYAGKSYRHLLVIKNGPLDIQTTPPHDISDKQIASHTPSGEGAERLVELMKRSAEILKGHQVNFNRKLEGKNTADSAWLWGQGRAPKMETFKERFGVTGSMISAVDLMDGIGVYAGLDIIKVPGATGYIDTDYNAKARYALESLETKDFICVHVEAPDEAGHQGLLKEKIMAIEDFDELIVGAMLKGLREKEEEFGGFRVFVLPDHPTPVELKTHTSDGVPFVMYSSTDVEKSNPEKTFTEASAKKSGVVEDSPDNLINKFFSK
jgi:2,3-bisphosphoglycerate-independent phosphoglycerate mutase